MSNESRPAIFVDRDNTLIADPGYLRDPEQVRILPGVPDALRRLRDAGFAVVVVTNQSGVARGYFTEEELRAVHERMQEMLAEKGAAVDAIYYCPFLPGREAVIERYRVDSELRKPNPGMILKAIGDLRLDPSRSWMIGDSARDVQAGKAAGCRTILLGSGATDPNARPDHTMSDFVAAADFILRETKRSSDLRSVLNGARRGAERAVAGAGQATERSAATATAVRADESAVRAAPPVGQPEPSPTPVAESRVAPASTELERKSMMQGPATVESRTTAPRAEKPATPPRTADKDQPAPAASTDDPLDILEQILEEVRAMRRQRQFADFSFTQLAGAIAQAFALCAIGFGLYSMVNGDSNRATVVLLAGIAFQLMALTGFMITRRR